MSRESRSELVSPIGRLPTLPRGLGRSELREARQLKLSTIQELDGNDYFKHMPDSPMFRADSVIGQYGATDH